jgi:hypothetical protein
MTPDKANELIAVQALMECSYNRNAVKLIPAEVQREHGPDAVDNLTTTLELERIFGFKHGTELTS